MSERLKPCPWCRKSDNLEIVYVDIDCWIAAVKCNNCPDMIGPWSKYKYRDKDDAAEDAASAWNRRTPGPATVAVLDAMQNAIEQSETVCTELAIQLDSTLARAFLAEWEPPA